MEFRKLLFFSGLALGIILGTGGNRADVAEISRYQKDPQSCAQCHVIKPYVGTWIRSDFLSHGHAQSGISCLDCHQLTSQRERENEEKFDQKAFKIPLEEREYENDLCLRCHGSYRDIIERTKDFKKRGWLRNPHDSHYGEVQCNLCHKAHRASINYCSQCHEAGTSKPGWETVEGR
jgi:hypothetical protein